VDTLASSFIASLYLPSSGKNLTVELLAPHQQLDRGLAFYLRFEIFERGVHQVSLLASGCGIALADLRQRIAQCRQACSRGRSYSGSDLPSRILSQAFANTRARIIANQP